MLVIRSVERWAAVRLLMEVVMDDTLLAGDIVDWACAGHRWTVSHWWYGHHRSSGCWTGLRSAVVGWSQVGLPRSNCCSGDQDLPTTRLPSGILCSAHRTYFPLTPLPSHSYRDQGAELFIISSLKLSGGFYRFLISSISSWVQWFWFSVNWCVHVWCYIIAVIFYYIIYYIIIVCYFCLLKRIFLVSFFRNW